MVSSPSRFVESTEGCIKERIREILSDNKDLVVVSEASRMLSNTLTFCRILQCKL